MSSVDKSAATIGSAKAVLIGLRKTTTPDADRDKQAKLRKPLIQEEDKFAKDRHELEQSGSKVREGKERIQRVKSVEATHNTLDQALPLSIASLPVTAQQRTIAFGIIIALAAGLVPTLWFATIAAPRIDAFVPVVQTVVCAANLVTAYFLFAQYSIDPRRALLALASGYMFTGLFAFIQSLEFPGAYRPLGLLGGGLSGAAWLFVFWHATFVLAVISYLLLRDEPPRDQSAKPPVLFDIVTTLAIVLAVVGALSWLGTSGNTHLPSLYVDVTQQTPLARQIVIPVLVLYLVALAWLLVRQQTMLDLWLIVTLCAGLPILAQGLFFSRFDLIFYITRTYTLIASSTVLVALLTETTLLYSRLSSALMAQRRERIGRLLSIRAATAALNHEVRQPLSVMALECGSALAMMERTPPNLEDVREALKLVEVAAVRVDQVFSSTRAIFESDVQPSVALDLNELTRQVLQIAHHELVSHGVTVTASYVDGLPQIRGDRTQLQQVILNLIRNALEAMEAVHPAERRLRLATRLDSKTVVVISVADSGPGIEPTEQRRIFEAFYTTKPTGTGLGLAICQSIVEEHHGTLRLAKGVSGGCVFEIALPVDQAAGVRP